MYLMVSGTCILALMALILSGIALHATVQVEVMPPLVSDDLMHARVGRHNIDELAMSAALYHIAHLDARGACNTSAECLAALDTIDPRFYAAENVRNGVFPKAYEIHVSAAAVHRIRQERHEVVSSARASNENGTSGSGGGFCDFPADGFDGHAEAAVGFILICGIRALLARAWDIMSIVLRPLEPLETMLRHTLSAMALSASSFV